VIELKKKIFKYGEPAGKEEIKPTRRLPQYDECLREFLNSESDIWKVKIEALPSQNIRVVLSSFKWRIKHKPEFENIRAFMRRNNIYLERVKNNE
jgi:hypothetical protein